MKVMSLLAKAEAHGKNWKSEEKKSIDTGDELIRLS